MGSSAYSAKATMASRSARAPSHGSGSSSPKSARLGMVWITLVLPSTRAFHRGRRVSSIPSGTPTAMASSIEIPTSHRCSAVRVATSRLWVSRKFKITSTADHADYADQPLVFKSTPPFLYARRAEHCSRIPRAPRNPRLPSILKHLLSRPEHIHIRLHRIVRRAQELLGAVD